MLSNQVNNIIGWELTLLTTECYERFSCLTVNSDRVFFIQNNSYWWDLPPLLVKTIFKNENVCEVLF